jgi:hypothetical protein
MNSSLWSSIGSGKSLMLLIPALAFGLSTTACTENPSPAEGEGEGEELVLPCGPDADFDDIERECGQDSDCGVLQIQVDCCGSQRMTGINDTYRIQTQVYANDCAEAFPICDCVPDPPTADDGTFASFGTPAVACIEDECSTTFP